MSKRIRKKYIIDKKMQFRLTIRFFFLTLLFSLFIGFEAYITVWPVVSGAIPEHLVGHVLSLICFRFLIFVLPVFLVIAAFSVVFSHRIAGPVYRLERTLDELIQGEDVEHIHVRKHDELQGLIEKTNKLIDIMQASKRAGKDNPLPK